MVEMLADSSFLYALYNVGDRYHPGAMGFAEEHTGRLIIPDVILPEVTFLMNRSGGFSAVPGFLEAFAIAEPVLVSLIPADIRRAARYYGRLPGVSA